ncbi:MAG: hypothetical protein WCJ09_26775 [Planctomycetota bacterium]
MKKADATEYSTYFVASAYFVISPSDVTELLSIQFSNVLACVQRCSWYEVAA